MRAILGQVEVCRSSQLLLNDKSLLQKLESPGQKFVLDFQEVTFAHVHLKGLVDDGKTRIVLDVLPTAVAVSYDACDEIEAVFYLVILTSRLQ